MLSNTIRCCDVCVVGRLQSASLPSPPHGVLLVVRRLAQAHDFPKYYSKYPARSAKEKFREICHVNCVLPSSNSSLLWPLLELQKATTQCTRLARVTVLELHCPSASGCLGTHSAVDTQCAAVRHKCGAVFNSAASIRARPSLKTMRASAVMMSPTCSRFMRAAIAARYDSAS